MGFYITTPIYYLNGLPHIGHAYTTIAADVTARYQRLKGHEVFFLTGTDEHGQKVLRTAEKKGLTPQQHCDELVQHWKAAWAKFNIQYDTFMRTTDPAHTQVVQQVLQKIYDDGLIYQDSYTGWYSTSEERFWTEKDLVDGKCPVSGQPVEKITENNYFFKMSAFQDQLVAHLESHPQMIQPESRRNEVLGFLRKPLEDLCISRPKSRMSWGIELPFDEEYVCYVWFDALLNYLSMVGYVPDGSDDYKRWWPPTFQLIGKDILTTHSVYWTTMLMALGVELPECLYAHGWWTVKGEKMSKSLGNTIDINLLADGFGVDPTRFFFLREIRFGADGGFSYDGFLSRYNTDLANDFGNMAHRGLSMTRNWLGGKMPGLGELTEADRELLAVAAQAIRTYDSELDQLHFNRAIEGLWELVRAGNKYIDTEQPWTLNKKGNTARLATVMRCVNEISAIAGTLLLPIMPERSADLLGRLGLESPKAALHRLLNEGPRFDLLSEGHEVTVGDPLFPRFRKLPENIAKLFDEEKPTPKPKKKPKQAAPEPPKEIVYEDFAKVQLRAGKVLDAKGHPDADRLLVLTVDVGEEQPRTIVAGIAAKFSAEEVVGRTVVVVMNLKPVVLRGVESQGMLLAAGGKNVVDLVSVAASPGEIVR